MYNSLGESKPRIGKSSIVLLSIALVLCVVYLILEFTGFFEPKPEPETFTVNELSITLNDTFAEKEYVGFTALYQSTDMMVPALRESFDELAQNGIIENPSECTVDEYAEVIFELNELSCELEKKDGFSYYEYTREVSGKEYTYRAYIFKSDDAFWMIQFGTFSSAFEEKTETIESYAKSITFN